MSLPPDKTPEKHTNAVWWQDGCLHLLDQRLLPHRQQDIVCTTAQETALAIRDMVVRGAPAIGITAAYGLVLSAQEHYRNAPDNWRAAMVADLNQLRTSRPTAVNLAWALDRMSRLLNVIDSDPVPPLLAEATAIHEEDIAANRKMGQLGAAFITEPCAVLTHCNAGVLATGGYGTALGVVRSGFAAGNIQMVYADETRPWLQGARLTAWELAQDGIPVTLIADGAAAFALGHPRNLATGAGREEREKKIAWVIVGADRVAANADVANKIGTYSLAIAARHHRVGFMVVAPTSTLDPNIPDGASIPIEMRSPEEILNLADNAIAPRGVAAWNPVFDVTPAALIDVLVTEKGAVERPDKEKIAALLNG